MEGAAAEIAGRKLEQDNVLNRTDPFVLLFLLNDDVIIETM
jgi:hypothetical protein